MSAPTSSAQTATTEFGRPPFVHHNFPYPHPHCQGRHRRRRSNLSDAPNQIFYGTLTPSCYFSHHSSQDRMGNYRSRFNDRKVAQRPTWIDRQIEQDGKKLEEECKILLLGPSESGKSTVIKQMCIAHQGGFCHDTKITYREAIYSNLIESAQAVAAALQKFKVEPANPSNVVSYSSDCGVSSFDLIRTANVGTRVGIQSQCGVTVSDMFTSLCFPKPTCRGYTPSLAGPSCARGCRELRVTVPPDGQCSLVSV